MIVSQTSDVLGNAHSPMGRLYWKICSTFLLVVIVSILAGGAVFCLVLGRLSEPIRSEALLAVAELCAVEVEKYLASGPAGGLKAHLNREYRGFPHLTILYAPPMGAVDGKLEPGREDLLAELRAELRTPPPPARIRPLGAGRGVLAIVPVGIGRGRHGTVLVAFGGVLAELQPAVIGAGVTSFAAILLVAAVLGLIVFRNLARRLEEVRDCLVGVAAGRLELRVPTPGPDEIGDLGRSFNRMAGQLQELVHQLADVDTKRRQFLADISHELKTPLTALRGHLERLLPKQEPDEVGSSLSVAFEEVGRLTLLIEDLLELSRMESATTLLRRKEEVLQRIASRVVERFAVAFENHHVRLATRFAPEPIRRLVDGRRLEQALANLMANALVHLPDGGTIEITVRAEGDRAVVEILDNGPGIRPEDLPHVFDRFFTGSAERGGTGLGLAIVKRLVEAHGGTVRLEPREQGGTRAIVEV